MWYYPHGITAPSGEKSAKIDYHSLKNKSHAVSKEELQFYAFTASSEYQAAPRVHDFDFLLVCW